MICYKKAMPKRFYTIAEACQRLSISRQTLQAAITSKRLENTEERTIKKTITKTITITVIPAAELNKFAKKISRSHQERGKKNESSSFTL